MDLRNLTIPNTFPGIVTAYKYFKQKIFEGWCILHVDDIYQAKIDLLNQMKSLENSKIKDSSVLICIGAIVLSSYSNARREDCANFLVNIKPPKDPASTEFITQYIAKNATKMQTINNFVENIIFRIQTYLESSNKVQLFYAKSLMINLATYATNAIDSCTSLYFDLLLKAFQSSIEDVMQTASQSLNIYFNLTKQKQYLPYLDYKATEFLSSRNQMIMKGGLLILTALIDNFPENFIDRVQFLMNATKQILNRDKSFSFYCFKIYIMFIQIKPGDYAPIANQIVKQIWPSNELTKLSLDTIDLLKIILRKYPVCLKDRVKSLLKIISNLFTLYETKYLLSGSELLELFMKNIPKEFSQEHAMIAAIFLNARFTDSIIPIFQAVIQANIQIFEDLKPSLNKLLMKLYNEHKMSIILKIIAFVPKIPKEGLFELTQKIIDIFNNDDNELKMLVPEALLSIANSEELIGINICQHLFGFAISSESQEVRISILKSFKEPYPGFLAIPSFLDQLEILVNDESFKVRRYALKILGGISSMNPSMIIPLFRSVILNCLFICNASKSIRVQSNAAKCLPIIFSRVPDLLPVYASVFLPIFIEYMTDQLSHHIDESVFEAEKENSKTVHMLNSLDFDAHSINTTVESSHQKNSGLSSFSSNSFLSHRNLSPALSKNSLQPSHDVKPFIPSLKPKRVEQQMTFIDRIFITKISIAYFKAIGNICNSEFKLGDSRYNEVIAILVKMIAISSQKKVLLAALSALSIIIDKIGPKEALKIPDLNSILFQVGSKNISSKVHTVLFSILGKIGPVEPNTTITADTYSSIDKEQSEYYDLTIPIDDFFLRVVKTNLDVILNDKSEASLHYLACEALTKSFTSCKKSINAQLLFNSYMVRLFSTIRSFSTDERRTYFKLVEKLLDCPTEWLQNFAQMFFNMIEELWDTRSQIDVIDLIPKIASALKDKFSAFLPRIVSMLLDAIDESSSYGISIHNPDKTGQKLKKLFELLTGLSTFATNFVFIIIRKLSEILMNSSMSNDTVSYGLDTLRSIIEQYDCTTYSSVIFHACIYCIQSRPLLKEQSYSVLHSLAISIGPKFDIYKSFLINNNLLDSKLEMIISNYYNTRFNERLFITDKFWRNSSKDSFSNSSSNLLEIDIDIPTEFNIITIEQWKNWIRSFIRIFIFSSPNPAIRNCSKIAKSSFIFSRKIFNAAFLSCWIKLSEGSKNNIKKVISSSLTSAETPMSVITILIDLLEFTERARVSIDESNNYKRTKWAFRAEKPTFALYCAQKDFDSQKTHTADNCLQLIQAYAQLGMHDELHGLIKVANIDELLSYKLLYKLNKLDVLGKWDEIDSLYPQCTAILSTEKNKVATIFAHAFLHLKKWAEFDKSISEISTPTADIFQCIRLAEEGKSIQNQIEKGLQKVGQQGGPLFLHGFSALAPFLVNTEQLIELKEYFIDHDTSKWEQRMLNTNCHFNIIQPLLLLRIEILKKDNDDEYHKMLLSYLKMARTANEWDAFEQFFDAHLSRDNYDIYAGYEFLHLLWKKGEEADALNRLNKMIQDPKNELIYARLYFKKAKWIARKQNASILLFTEIQFESNSSEFRMKSESQSQVQSNLLDRMRQVRELCEKAMEIRHKHYPTLNLWSWACMRIFDIGSEERENAAIQAITGFADCVRLDLNCSYFDLLQMTSILFRSTSFPNVFEKVFPKIHDIELKRYLKIIPQLIMYKRTHSKSHRKFILSILSQILQIYSNAVIFPLLFVRHYVAGNLVINNDHTKDDDKDICAILDEFKLTNKAFYNAAENLSYGFQDACFTFSEFLYEGINNIHRDAKLQNISNLLSSVPKFIARVNNLSCPYDFSIMSRYRDKIQAILNTLEGFMKDLASQMSKNANNENSPAVKQCCSFIVNRSSDWISLIKMIAADTSREFTLSLKSVAPKLENFHHPAISVFNTFKPDSPIVGISKIVEDLRVKQTKQRPRKVKILGTDGKSYKFLLKGHEDLRLDQRVMQFFDLMNSITVTTTIPQIIITGVTPLSPNVGIIQWIPGCSTMYQLIYNCRAIQKLKSIEVENDMMKKIFIISQKNMNRNGNPILNHKANDRVTSASVDSLRPIQRLEYFRKVAEATRERSYDLRDMLWIQARNAESWVRHTITFSKTSALMSIVGYMIGLGDRHPANIMIQKMTGHVIHIDFNDCFEVTKERDKMAETIPFRLTRNMIATLGPCSYEGSFRKTCEETCFKIRQKREAVISILEIFIRDPTSSGGFFEIMPKSEAVSGSYAINKWMGEIDSNDIQNNQLKEKISRISQKINGLDFENDVPLSVHDQVDALIRAATDMYNLSYLYHGWNPFW